MSASQAIKNLVRIAAIDLASISSTPQLDAEILMSYVLKIEVDRLIFIADQILNAEQHKQYQAVVSKRKQRMPIAYIVGSKEFWGLSFLVDRNVLVPRADTEVLIDAVLEFFNNKDRHFSFIDLGTGSGCIGISICKEFVEAKGLLIDQSEKALAIAKKNAIRHGVESKLLIAKSDWFSNVKPQKFDLIIANPPYVEINSQETIGIEHEPDSALYAAGNGLADYRKIAAQSYEYLDENGYIILEIGHRQAAQVIEIFNKFTFIKKIKDYPGNDRALIFRL